MPWPGNQRGPGCLGGPEADCAEAAPPPCILFAGVVNDMLRGRLRKEFRRGAGRRPPASPLGPVPPPCLAPLTQTCPPLVDVMAQTSSSGLTDIRTEPCIVPQCSLQRGRFRTARAQRQLLRSGSMRYLRKQLETCHLCCRWSMCEARLGQMEIQTSMRPQWWVHWSWSHCHYCWSWCCHCQCSMLPHYPGNKPAESCTINSKLKNSNI